MTPTEKAQKPDRPSMPAGYGIRKDGQGQLDWSWVDERMQTSRNYWISSTRPDGRPHAMPVWGVWLDGSLYFGTNRKSVKGRNLANDPRVAVHLESGDEAVMIESVATEVHDNQMLTRIAQAFSQKYPGMPAEPDTSPEVVYYAVRPKVVLAWLENDFPNTATRWRLEED